MPDEFQYDVFLSHTQADKPRVRRLAERLREAGLRVWFDEWIIQPGDDIYLSIEHGLQASRTLVLCLSPAALGSHWVDLERSTALFRDPENAGRRFIPLLLADCKLPDTLRRYKHVDCRRDDDEATHALLAACRTSAVHLPSPEAPPKNEPKRSDGVSRRNVLSALCLIGATLIAERLVGRVFRDFRTLARPGRQKCTDSFRRLLYPGSAGEITLSGGLLHLFQNYDLSAYEISSTYLAAQQIRDALALRDEAWFRHLPTSVTLPPSFDRNTNIIALGSPINDLITREALEYSGENYRFERKAPTLRLPIEYVMHVDRVGAGHVKARRYVTGVEKEMPNWSIKVDGHQLSPELDRRGWLLSDYLLISRIPNLLSPQARYSGKEIVIVGGTHGVGTEAIRLLVENHEYLSEVERQTRGLRFYQVLLKVDGIRHSYDPSIKANHSKPVSLRMPPIVKSIDTTTD